MQTVSDLGKQFIASRAQLHEAAARILGCRHRADDVVHDAYLKLADGGEAPHIRHAPAYLHQMVRNLAIDRHRRGQFESQVFSPEECGLAVGVPHTPESQAMHAQHLRIVARALAALPERTRSAFEMHRIGGHTQREVATSLGISATMVNFLIRDAMACCRRALRAA